MTFFSTKFGKLVIYVFILIAGSGIVLSAIDEPQPAVLENVSSMKTRVPSLQEASSYTPVENRTSSSVDHGTNSSKLDSGLSNDDYYTNTFGNRVHSPAYANTVPAGASAQCNDGTYSFSQSRRGTCSHHGGVSNWY